MIREVSPRSVYESKNLSGFFVPILSLTGLLAVLTFLISTFTPTSASAEHASCPVLRQQLASLSIGSEARTRARSPEFARLNDLVKRQRRALRRANRDARALGCRFQGRFGGECNALLSKIDRMESNLARLMRARDREANTTRAQSSRGSLQQRRAIQSRMARLGCASGTALARGERSERRGFFQRLFGSRKRRQLARLPENDLFGDRDRAFDGGVYRTLCVRHSDGYYFPVSFATVRSQFAVDDAYCQASNPNDEMQLFVHLNPGERVEDMVSLDGVAYANLPNAFRYRYEFVADSFNSFSKRRSNLETVGGLGIETRLRKKKTLSTSQIANPAPETVLPRPEVKPRFFIDQDLQFSLAGKFKPRPVDEQPIDTLGDAIASELYDPSTIEERGIRVVGPTFLADQEAVELLQAPDQIQVQ